MPIPRAQLRLTDEELDEILRNERTVHIATASADGWPHVVPLWFVWRDGAMWINNLRRSKRSRDIREGSPVAVCVDTGVAYQELRGAVLYGRFETADDELLEPVKTEFARKYWGVETIPDLKSHQWLRLKPERIASWDFRKIPVGRDRRLDAGKPQVNG